MSEHGPHSSPAADRRWLSAALAVIVAFMVGEVVAGILAHSLALLTDAAHMLTDAAAIGVAIVASAIAQRPARGRYTYGFARADALSGQANGITLVVLAILFAVEAVRRLVHPGPVTGAALVVVAAIGVLMNALATALVGRANRADSLSVRGVVAHLVTDLGAFVATAAAGIVVLAIGWDRADPIASLAVAAVMAWTGWRLVREAGRVFLEAAPSAVDPADVAADLVATGGVVQVHDLHVWQLGPSSTALSAHVLVEPSYDCHEVAGRLRELLRARHGIRHVTLQTDHADTAGHDAACCEDAHGAVHAAPSN